MVPRAALAAVLGGGRQGQRGPLLLLVRREQRLRRSPAPDLLRGGHRSRAHALRGAQRRREDRLPAVSAPGGEELKRAQRSLARKKPGSNNREKARHKVARVHARVADARRDFHHQLSTRIIRENQAVAVETLPVAKLARTRLSKSVRDAGWSAFVDMLEYKAARYGRTFTKIGRYEQTSQTCSACHVNSGPKALDIRKWTCPACGTPLDRDVNAAINIATAAGLAVTACGARVRPGRVPAPRHEAGTHPKPRRPSARQAEVARR